MHKNSLIVFTNFSIETIIKSSEKNFNVNQIVEFYDIDNNCWSEANIQSMNNDFYIVSYSNKSCLNNTETLYKNNIRALTTDSCSHERQVLEATIVLTARSWRWQLF